MSIFQALIIGLLQGLTEFLPVSSSAHLKLAKLFFHIENSETQIVFDLVCHLGTLFALLYFLKREILTLIRTDRRKLLLLFVATLPLIPCYFLLKPLREIASHTHFLGPCLLVTSLILFAGQKLRFSRNGSKPWKDVLWIGTLQSAALIPGISRSASTISCAKVLGWDAKEAVRFSFLLSIPTIVGGNCLELLKLLVSSQAPLEISPLVCTVGFIAALGSGLLIIRFALAFLEKGNLKPFAIYCLGMGTLVTLMFSLGAF
jgi:undecaprenyl-diphosphatase